MDISLPPFEPENLVNGGFLLEIIMLTLWY